MKTKEKILKDFIDFAKEEIANGANIDELLSELRSAILSGNDAEEEIKANDIFFSVLKQNQNYYDQLRRNRN